VVESWLEVVWGLQGWVCPLSSRLVSSHDDRVVEELLAVGNGVVGGLDIWVSTKGWNWIVDWVTLVLWMKILGAASRVADWVGLSIKLNFSSILNIAVSLVVDWLWHNPVSILVLLRIPRSVDALLLLHRVEGMEGINVVVVLIIVEDGWLGSWQLIDHEFMLELLLSILKGGINSLHVVIFSKIWNWIVHWVSLNLWMLVLSATS
jgi:hypothetical protein